MHKMMHRIGFAAVMGAVVFMASGAAMGEVADPVIVSDIPSEGYWGRLTFTTLQGVVNRNKGRLYLVTRGSDQHWIDWYEKRYGVQTRKVQNPWKLFDIFSESFEGWVVVDRMAPDTANIASNYASMRDVVPVTIQMLRNHAQQLPDKPIVIDLRDKFRGMTKVEIYRWALQHQWPKLNHSVVANLNVPPDAVDISQYTRNRDTLYVLIEDTGKQSGNGPNVHGLRFIRNGEVVVHIDAGSPGEKRYIVVNQGSHVAGDTRQVSRQDFVIYKVSGIRGAQWLDVTITNQYSVKIAPKRFGPWVEVARSESNSGRFNMQADIRDFVVANRGFTFMLSSKKSYPKERRLKGRIFASMPPAGRVYGWSSMHGESEQMHVRQGSKHGLIILCSNTATNFSFHQHIEDSGVYRQEDPRKRVRVDPSKVYITFVMSDGDSLNFLSNLMHGKWWDEAREKLRLGWEMQPLLAQIAPGMLRYFYTHANPNETFVASASGIGYFFPDKMPMPALARTLRATRPFLKRTDMETLVLLQSSGGHPRHNVSREVNRLYAKILDDLLIGVQEGYWYTAGENRMVGSLAWMPTRLAVLGRVRGNPVTGMVKGFEKMLKQKKPGRALFVPFHVPKGHMSFHHIVEALSRLDRREKFVVLGPETFFRAFKQAARRRNGG